MFFLKHATESSFLISIGVLFHSLVAETAKERPPSVSLLYLVTSVLALVLTADQHQGSSVMKLRPKECRVKYPAILP